MLPFARCLIRLSIAACACAVCPLVSAQRPVIPAPHPTAPVHMQAPPVYRAPMNQTPMMRQPIVHAPILTPRPVTVPSSGAFGLGAFRPPIRPVRPHPPVIFIYNPIYAGAGSYWPSNFCWWATCDVFWPWTFGYPTVSSPGPTTYVSQVYETPVYVYRDEREDLPELYLNNGAILSVTDYWVTDGQLHFTIIEESGAKPVEHSIPFAELDLQKTIDANTSRGFRFLLRNEPFEQYVRDHPEGPPALAAPPKQ